MRFNLTEKATISSLNKAWIEWNFSNKVLRFGQFIVNEGFVKVPCTDVFYSRDEDRVYREVMQAICVRDDYEEE